MINADAIAVTGLLPDPPGRPRFDRILATFSRYAGRSLDWDRQVDASESATGFRNRAIAKRCALAPGSTTGSSPPGAASAAVVGVLPGQVGFASPAPLLDPKVARSQG